MARQGQFQPGQSGNPSGRKPRAVEEKYLKAVAKSMPAKDWALVLEKVKQLAMRGERWAVEFYADRLIGKPTNPVEVTGEIEFGVKPVDYRLSIAALAPRPMDDSDTPGESESTFDGATLG